MYFLPVSSSGVVYHKAIEELRDVDFETFQNIVVQRLAKEVELKPNVFNRDYVGINYKDLNNSTCYHKYRLPKSYDDQRSGCRPSSFFSCRDSSRSRSRQESMKIPRLTIVNQTYMERINFWQHLKKLCLFLMREECLRAEGIFLKIGSRDKQRALRDDMKSNREIDFSKSSCSVYDFANVLKQFLHQMPEPLFASKYYPAYERIAKIENSFEKDDAERRILMIRRRAGQLLPPNSELFVKEKKLLDCLQYIVHLMPHRKREIFEQILDVLQEVNKNRAYNRMSANGLGSIFAPLIITPRSLPREVSFSVSRQMSSLISRMIKVGKDVFGNPSKLGFEVWDHVRDTPLPATAFDDARISELFNSDF